MPPRRKRRGSSGNAASQRSAGNERVFEREGTPAPSFPFTPYDDPSDDPSTSAETTTTSTTGDHELSELIWEREPGHKMPCTAAIPEETREWLLDKKVTPLQILEGFERWATHWFKQNKSERRQQSTYSMFMACGRAIFEANNWGEMPVDIWFRLPQAVKSQWWHSAGIAKLAVSRGCKKWRLNDRRLVKDYIKRRERLAFRPYPSHSLGGFPFDCVPRADWNERVVKNKLAPIATAISAETQLLPPVQELLQSAGPVDYVPKWGWNRGSAAKCPYDDYHYRPSGINVIDMVRARDAKEARQSAGSSARPGQRRQLTR